MPITYTLEKRFFAAAILLTVFVLIVFRQSKKMCNALWFAWVFFGFSEKRRPSEYFLWEASKFFYIWIVSLMCHCVNLLWKIAVQNAGRVFTYFCGGQKSNLWLQFRSSFHVILAIRTFEIETIIFWNFHDKTKKRFPNKLQNGDIELVCITRVLGC